jgi:hypothetical protein
LKNDTYKLASGLRNYSITENIMKKFICISYKIFGKSLGRIIELSEKENRSKMSICYIDFKYGKTIYHSIIIPIDIAKELKSIVATC